MASRRDFLSLFGAGAIVAPVIGGLATSIGAQARIIEPAKIELIEPPRLDEVGSLPSGKILKIAVEILDDRGAHYHMDCLAIEDSVEIGRNREGNVVTTLRLWSHSGHEGGLPRYMRVIR